MITASYNPASGDRLWAFECRDNRACKITEWPNYVTSFQVSFEYECPYNGFITGTREFLVQAQFSEWLEKSHFAMVLHLRNSLIGPENSRHVLNQSEYKIVSDRRIK